MEEAIHHMMSDISFCFCGNEMTKGDTQCKTCASIKSHTREKKKKPVPRERALPSDETIIREYTKGTSLYVIYTMYQVSEGYVSRIRKKYNLPVRDKTRVHLR